MLSSLISFLVGHILSLCVLFAPVNSFDIWLSSCSMVSFRKNQLWFVALITGIRSAVSCCILAGDMTWILSAAKLPILSCQFQWGRLVSFICHQVVDLPLIKTANSKLIKLPLSHKSCTMKVPGVFSLPAMLVILPESILSAKVLQEFESSRKPDKDRKLDRGRDSRWIHRREWLHFLAFSSGGDSYLLLVLIFTAACLHFQRVLKQFKVRQVHP